MVDRQQRLKYRILGIIVVLSLLLLAPLLPQWTFWTYVTYVGLWVVMVFPLLYLSNPTRYKGLLRIAAAFIAVVFILASIDHIRTQMNAQKSVLTFRSPITGFIVIGLPALWFAITGRSRHIEEHEQYYQESDDPD